MSEHLKCPVCRKSFDPSTDHRGHPGRRPRAYCSLLCRGLASGARRSKKRAHLKAYGRLIELHDLEERGLIVAMPNMPELPPVPEMR